MVTVIVMGDALEHTTVTGGALVVRYEHFIVDH